MSGNHVGASGAVDMKTAYQGLLSDQGALRGEQPGRPRNPVIKVADLGRLEFEKPDLDRAEAFARVIDFGAVACSEDFAQQGAARHRTKVSF